MSSPTSPHRIVVIEDNAADALLLEQALNEQQEPYTLEVLRDGEEALRFVREHCATGPDPCLIVLDLHLPRYDGQAVLRALRREPALAHVKVAVVTSLASPLEREQVVQLGVQAYLTKPMDWDETVDLAKHLMELCKSSSNDRAHRANVS